MYTVMGITGQVGGATAHALLKDGKKVQGIVRDKAKAAAWEKEGVELVNKINRVLKGDTSDRAHRSL